MRTHSARSFGLFGWSVAILLATFGTSSLAQPGAAGEGHGQPGGEPGGEGGHRRAPPAAAFEACKDRKVEEVCVVTFGDRKLTGKCAATAAGELYCHPDRRPGPPPELFTACEGKAEGEGCTIQLEDGERQGRCGKGRSGRLLCLPH
jgi:hypothetical protein